MGNKMKNLFSIFFLFLVYSTYVQSVEVDLIAAALEDVSEEYFLEDVTYAYIDTDMEPAAFISNVTIIKSIPVEAEVKLNLFGYSMGDYRIPVGMEYISPMCDVFEEKLILAPIFTALGFSEDDCPPKMGVYDNPGYTPDLTEFPESFPRNQYLVQFQVTLDDKPIVTVKVYVEVL